MFRILAITATLIGVMSAAHADVWRWTDAQGRIQYSDKWVPGSVLIKSDRNHPSMGDPNAASESTDSADQQHLATSNANIADQQAQRATEDTVKQDVAKIKEKQCKEATANYEKAIQSRRIYKDGKDGAREYLTDAEADAYRARVLTDRKSACGK
ncbi:MAG: DUF4124 domain-containing protein [Gammaproteobacteria bacterium]